MKGMNSRNSKAHVHSKSEPLDLSSITEAVKTMMKEETLDFPEGKKVEPVLQAEPFDLPKVEKLKPYGKTEPLDFSGAKVKPFDQPRIGSTFRDEERKNLLLQLTKIRDFIRLMLSYPMRTVHDSKLNAWTCEVSNRRHSLQDLHRLLTQKPLKCFRGLLPIDILMNVERGWSPIFDSYCVIPGTILNLAANLAVDQLRQTFLSEDDHVRNIHRVLLSTRNEAEKRLVMEKIQSVSKDKEIMLRLHETYAGVLLIDASYYESQVEVHVRRQIAQLLQLPVIEGNGEWLMTSIEKEMSSREYLVFLVDGDAEEPLDLQKVGFSGKDLAGVVVLITILANEKLTLAMDLNITIRDHLFPWELFCRNVDNELLRSPNVIQTIASRIAEECGSHLLAILIVVKSLRNAKYVKDWEHALDKLNSLHPSYDISMFHGQSSVMVKAFINFSWCDMSKRHKHCLTCCLFIPKIKFGKLENELINDWISSQLVASGEAEHVLRNLVDHFVLLQFGDTKSRYIQMPEDTYAILQSLNDQNPVFMKKSGLGLVEPPNSELWHSSVQIDLADNKLLELPLSPICLELKVLMLHGNIDLIKIPPLFFFKMPILCVLDLSYSSVRELPNSFFELEQLRELYMKGCERFMKLPLEVRKLRKLEKLDLDKTQIIHKFKS